jgi:hypothetical protein
VFPEEDRRTHLDERTASVARGHHGWHTAEHAFREAPSRRLVGSLCLLPNVRALLDAGEATRGCTATVRGGHTIVGRVDEAGADPRFRMTLLKGDTYGLSLYHRKKWDPLPFEGTLTELVDVMNTALAHWATDWSLPDPSGLELSESGT